ncbi:hypothetical protein HOY80DRAFT_1038094 [Tuber brumale]|nr:hypothetical protein HOY80DRAFT_1038094 [Tuber brumale]
MAQEKAVPRRMLGTIPREPPCCVNDDAENLQWIYAQALQGARGVNSCSVTGSQTTETHIGNEGVYTDTVKHEKTDTFPGCGNRATYFIVDPQWPLEGFMDELKQPPDVQILSASLVNERRKLYYLAPARWNDQARPNLENKRKNVVDNREFKIIDPGLIFRLR